MLVKIFEEFDLSQNFENWSKFLEIFILIKIFGTFQI